MLVRVLKTSFLKNLFYNNIADIIKKEKHTISRHSLLDCQLRQGQSGILNADYTMEDVIHNGAAYVSMQGCITAYKSTFDSSFKEEVRSCPFGINTTGIISKFQTHSAWKAILKMAA
ncbi:MAG: hypothetical protein IPL08_21490 [Saprospiraceae bacterium]|nr:hypothetical protein [Saprospiraceae bacterium]